MADIDTARFRVDLADERLWKGDAPVQITNKAFQLLRFFIRNPNRLIAKDEILEKLWPGVYVTEGLIKEYVHDLRAALGDDPKRPLFIETVRARGYRYLGGIEEMNGAENAVSESGAGAGASSESASPITGALPSIAVLPFGNLQSNADDDYLAEGIVEDIIVSLARLHELTVIDRGSTLAVGRERHDPQEVGRLLDVNYLLRGSLRRSGPGLAMSVQLLETTHGETIFAERFNSPLEKIFDIQDEIVERVVVSIGPTVQRWELRQALRKRPNKYSAYDYVLHALDIMNDLDADTFARAGEFLDAAMKEDPGFATAFAWAARWLSVKIGQGWSTNREEDAREAVRLAKRAIDLDPNNAMALATCGHLQSFLFHDYDSALAYLARSRECSPSCAPAWIVSSATESYLGRGEEAIRMAERALRLSPGGSNLYFFYNFMSMSHYVAGNYDEAIKWARLSEIEHPSFTSNVRGLCASLSAAGKIEEARETAATLMALEPDFRLSIFEKTRLPYKPPALRKKFMSHLRLAGLPE
jgi:adenylate cyclase